MKDKEEEGKSFWWRVGWNISKFREWLEGPDPMVDELILKIVEGNPGAINALRGLNATLGKDFDALAKDLIKHKICGPKLWLGYNDYANGNADVLASAVLRHSPELLTAIRAGGYPDWDWADE